jgi:actin-related protein
VLLLEPAGGWDDELKTRLFKYLSSVLKSPSFSILSTTVATLYSFGLSRGVVVNMGHETASVSIGWDGNAITSATQHLEIGSSPETIVQSIMKAIEIACQQLDTSQEVLSQKIVLVGGRLLANELLKSKLCTMLDSKGTNWCTVPCKSKGIEEESEEIIHYK